MIRAIAFDFDGVLAESVDVKTQAYKKLFEAEEEAAVKKILEYHLENGGVSRFVKFRTIYSDILNRSLLEKEFQSLCSRFSKLVVDEVVASPWVEGAQEFLAQYENQYQFAIISGTPEAELLEIVRQRSMEQYFEIVRGSPKDKVTLLLEMMSQFDLKPQEILFVGDAVTDWNAARDVGVHFFCRCVSNEIPSFPGYSGPRLPSLSDLSLNIKQFVSS